MRQTFVYGGYSYDYFIVFSDRKTFGLMVRPDLRVIAKAPNGATTEEIEAFLRRKWLWLQKQLNELKQYQKKYYEPEYVSGESLPYLGRRYMLIVEQTSVDAVILERGKLRVRTKKKVTDTNHTKMLIEGWYNKRRLVVFSAQYKKALQLFNYQNTPSLRVRIMARRWGSYTQDNKVSLNPKLIEAPTEAIYYVLVHELCHVNNKKHDAAFYISLEKRVKDWRKIKQMLEIRYG